MIKWQYLIRKNQLNLYDDSKSLFSPDKYSIEDDCDWDKPCCFISSKGEQWKLKVCIETYEILEIVRNGVIASNNSDEFQNIINKLKEWLTLPSAIPWCTGTNKQAAYEYGFENPFRQIIKYDFCGEFQEGFAIVRLNDKFGFIDESGCEITRLKYDKAHNFYKGYAAVCVNDKWGFINSRGNEICDLKYDRVLRFYKGRAFVGLVNNNKSRFGFIKEEGKEICELKYNYIKPIDSSYDTVAIQFGDKCCHIDIDGNVTSNIKYDHLSFPIYLAENDVAAVAVNGKWGVINKQGETVSPIIYNSEEEAFGSVGVKVKGLWLF